MIFKKRLIHACAIFIFFYSTLLIHISQAAGTPNEFAIMMWGPTPSSTYELKRIKEAGINIAGFATPAQFNLLQSSGLKAFYWPPANELETAIKDSNIANNPAVIGYVLDSEFGTSKFAALGATNDLFQKNYPSKIPLMNLFPTMATSNQLEAGNYQEYLDTFVKTVHPSLLCYDQYSLMEDGTVNNTYWDSLEAIRAAALKNSIPFWNVVQAVGHMHFREPSAADLRFQAFTTLAYGGTGIVYFNYQAYPIGNYRGAPVDQFGNETQAWQWMQNTNHQILALAPTMMQLKSDDVYHFGEIPPTCHGPLPQSLIQGLAGNIVVGDFTGKDGSRYVLLVNKDLQKSIQCWPKFRAGVTSVEKFSDYQAGKIIPLDYEERFLAPGQGMLLKLKM